MSPLVTLLPPLLVIPFIIYFGERKRNWREFSIFVAGGILLALNIALYDQFLAGQSHASGSIEIFDGLSLYLKAEPLGLLFGILASFLWIVTTLYSIGYMRGHNEQNQTRFYVCFAIAIASVMGAAYAGNLLTLFIAYEAITLSTFPLVTHAGTEQAKRAGRIYLGVLMGGSIVLLMPAIIIIWWLTGSLDFVSGGVFSADSVDPTWISLLLLLVVFGTGKAAIMPFHTWLPNAMVAPTPVSALLHAVAVVKTGVFLILKTIVYIFGLELVTANGTTEILLAVSAATIILASLVALRKDNLKARLAYSTIGQLAYIVMAALIANIIAVEGAALHIVTHAFGKITLFFCAGAIMVALHKKSVSQLDGVGKQIPFTMAAFFIAALSIIGLPPLAGVWSKVLISEGAIAASHYWLVAVLMLSSLLNIAYLLPIPLRAFFSRSNDEEKEINAEEATLASLSGTKSPIQEAPLACLLAIGITTLGCIVLFFEPQAVTELVNKIPWE